MYRAKKIGTAWQTVFLSSEVRPETGRGRTGNEGLRPKRKKLSIEMRIDRKGSRGERTVEWRDALKRVEREVKRMSN